MIRQLKDYTIQNCFTEQLKLVEIVGLYAFEDIFPVITYSYYYYTTTAL